MSKRHDHSEGYPCGHKRLTPGCGGCDPGAIEYVLTDDGVLRPFDPARDMRGRDAPSLPTSDVIRAALETYTKDDRSPEPGQSAAVWREVARSVRRGEAVTVVDPKAGGPQ